MVFRPRCFTASDKQINVLVPAGLTKAKSRAAPSSLQRTVPAAPASTVQLASMAPAIFPGAVLNQDYSVNSVTAPARVGSVIQVFATGLSGAGAITAQIHDRMVTVPYYGGPAPGLTGVQQVDIVVPGDLPAMTTDVYVCGYIADRKVCSAPARVTLSQ